MFSRSRIWLRDNGVRSASLSSCCRRSSMMRRAWSIGMVVQSEVTSKDTMISSSSIVCWRMKVDNDFAPIKTINFIRQQHRTL